jgi:hypothetical protein
MQPFDRFVKNLRFNVIKPIEKKQNQTISQIVSVVLP